MDKHQVIALMAASMYDPNKASGGEYARRNEILNSIREAEAIYATVTGEQPEFTPSANYPQPNEPM